MQATVIEIADAAVTMLNGLTLSQTFTAARRSLPIDDVKDLTGLQITVMPHRRDSSQASRAERDHEHTIDIAVQKQAKATNDAVDPMVLLVDEADDALATASNRKLTLDTKGFAAFVSSVIDPYWIPQHLNELKIFTGIIRVTYKIIRS